LIFWWL